MALSAIAASSASIAVEPQRSYGVHGVYSFDDLGGADYYFNTVGCLLGVQHVRISAPWNWIQPQDPGQGAPDYDWTVMDANVAEAAEAGIAPIVIIAESPIWANGGPSEPGERGTWWVPQDEVDFLAWRAKYLVFVEALVERYHKGVKHWELWNEPNIDHFWMPEPNAVQYAQWAESVYAKILEIDPTAKVAFGSLTSLDVVTQPGRIAGKEFLQDLYESLEFLPEIVSIHPYGDPVLGPDAYPASAPVNSFRDIETIRAVMLANESTSGAPPGWESEIWVTEFGWKNGYANTINDSLRADYIERSVEIIEREYPYVTSATWFWDWDRDAAWFESLRGFGLIVHGIAGPFRLFPGEIWNETARQVPVWINGFEAAADFVVGPGGWTVWTNAPGPWPPGVASREDHGPTAKPRGGMQKLLRLVSGAIASGSSPGFYAATPTIPVTALKEHTLSYFSRSTGAATAYVVPFNSSGPMTGIVTVPIPISGGEVVQTTAAFTPPSGATHVKIRFRVEASNSTLEVDLLKVGFDREPQNEAVCPQ